MSPRFLVWDFDGTLATRRGGWAGALAEVIASRCPGVAIDAEALRPHLRRGFPWHTPEVVRAPGSSGDWWDALAPVFGSAIAGVAGLPEAEARRAAAEVRTTFLRRDSWVVFEDTSFALEQLRDRGWTHVLLSNHVPELESLMEELGLTRFFEAVYNSAVTGKEKPNKAAFECVFADFPEARSGWMIGDSWSADVSGATAAGMRSILVRNRHPEATHGFATLRELVPFLDCHP
jgi:putative hydrolase of the HAD superfamily